MRVVQRIALAAVATTASAAVTAGFVIAPAAGAQTRASFIGRFGTVTTIASTVPGNGDVNPYGVAVVTHSQGKLHRGDVLVSNFNNSGNFQGAGEPRHGAAAPAHRFR